MLIYNASDGYHNFGQDDNPQLGATTRTITLQDEDLETVERMLSFLYEGDYDQGDSADEEQVARNNIKLYVTADKFNIDSLKEVAKDRFIKWYKDYRGDKFKEVTREALKAAPPHDDGFSDAVTDSLERRMVEERERLMDDELIDVLEDCGALKEMFKRMVTWNSARD